MLMTFNGAHSTDKLEGDGGHILTPPPSISAPFYGYFKLVKATQKGEKLKQVFKVTAGN